MAESTTLPTDAVELLKESARHAGELFAARFGRPAKWLAAAPGRVNIIGDHTDYNDGFVLPMAIERYVVIAAAPSPGTITATVFASDLDQQAQIRLAGAIEPGRVTWSSYVQGVVAEFLARGFAVEPFDAVIHSTVPLGGGLSSSAALEVATATVLEAISGAALDRQDKALLCQQAEHRYAGMPCGIMDQFSSVLCHANHLMLLDCRSRTFEMVPMTDPRVTVVIANSNVRHELTGGEYAQRRAECTEAAQELGVASLREATPEQVAAASGRIDPVRQRRARHVTTENERTQHAATAIAAGDWQRAGELMFASHASLRDDCEVSCPELDLLVDLARQQPGVIGSRMTGGGFGGCTVSLVWTEQAEQFVRELRLNCYRESHTEPAIFVTRPAAGARVL